MRLFVSMLCVSFCQVFNPMDPDGDNDYQALMFFPDKCCFVQRSRLGKDCLESQPFMIDSSSKPESLPVCFRQECFHEEVLVLKCN